MKLVNIGCGYIFHPSWINLDLVPVAPQVQRYDARRGLPFSANEVDVCYSSHVLEHLHHQEAVQFLAEANRILKPQGIIRIVVPDLEAIVRYYLKALDQLEAGEQLAEPVYDWMVLELLDQMVRSQSGGAMGCYLDQLTAENRPFVATRVGGELELYYQAKRKTFWQKIRAKSPGWFLQKARYFLAEILVALVAGSSARQAFREGLFRHSGEVHRWMYDRFSLKRLLEQSGFSQIRICRADESQIPDFSSYQLDTLEGQVRKPDSLFIEGRKR